MSRYISTQSRIQVDRIATSVRSTAAGIQRYAQECATLIPDYDPESLPTVAELRSTVAELAAVDHELALLPEPVLALVQAYEPTSATNVGVETLNGLVDRLAADEQLIINDAFVDALVEMGFKVHQNRNADTAMIWAISLNGEDANAIAVEVAVDGQVGIDHAGCATDSCVPVQTQLLEGVAARGVHIDMDRAFTDEHHRRAGGSLFTKWQQMEKAGQAVQRRREAAARHRMVAR
jgi:hypothetical protein